MEKILSFEELTEKQKLTVMERICILLEGSEVECKEGNEITEISLHDVENFILTYKVRCLSY